MLYRELSDFKQTLLYILRLDRLGEIFQKALQRKPECCID